MSSQSKSNKKTRYGFGVYDCTKSIRDMERIYMEILEAILSMNEESECMAPVADAILNMDCSDIKAGKGIETGDVIWHNCDGDMKRLCEKFPDVVFRLHSVCGVTVFDVYYLNGKKAFCVPRWEHPCLDDFK